MRYPAAILAGGQTHSDFLFRLKSARHRPIVISFNGNAIPNFELRSDMTARTSRDSDGVFVEFAVTKTTSM